MSEIPQAGRARTIVVLVVALGALAVMAAAPLVLAKDSSAVAAAKAATVRFHSLKQAEQAGYGPFYICTDNEALDAAMGQHYADGSRIDDQVLDVTEPGGPRLRAEEQRLRPRRPRVRPARRELGRGPRLAAAAVRPDAREDPAGNRYGLPEFYEIHAWLIGRTRGGCSTTGTRTCPARGTATPPDPLCLPERSPGTVRRAAVRSCPRPPDPARALPATDASDIPAGSGTTAPARHAPSARYDRRELRKAPHAARNTAPSSIRAPGAPDGVGTALLRRSVHPVHAGPHGAPQRGSAAGDPHGLRRRLRLAPDPCCAVDS